MIREHLKQLTEGNRVECKVKCKELHISFSKVPRDFNPILKNDKCVKVVESCTGPSLER